MAPAKRTFMKADPGVKSRSAVSGIPKFGIRTAKITKNVAKNNAAVSKSTLFSTVSKGSKLRFDGMNKSKKTVRFKGVDQDKVLNNFYGLRESRKTEVKDTEKTQNSMSFPTHYDQSEIEFEEDPDALASILNNEGVTGCLLQKSQVKNNLKEGVKQADEFLLLPDGRPSLCRRVPINRISFVGDGTRSSLISARPSVGPGRVPVPGRDSTRNSLYKNVESRYSHRGVKPDPVGRKTFLQGGRVSVIEVQGGKKLHADNPKHLNNLPACSPAMRVLKANNLISDSPALRVRSAKKKDVKGCSQKDVCSPKHRDNLAKALFQDEENVSPQSKKTTRSTDHKNRFIKPKSAVPKKTLSYKAAAQVKNIPMASKTNLNKVTYSRNSCYGNSKNGSAGVKEIVRPRTLNRNEKRSTVSTTFKTEKKSTQPYEPEDINVVRPKTLNSNVNNALTTDNNEIVKKGEVKLSTGVRKVGIGAIDVLNLMQKKMESIKRRSVQTELTSVLKSVEMTLKTAIEEEDENVAQPQNITLSEENNQESSTPSEVKNAMKKEDIDIMIPDSNTAQSKSPAVSEAPSWKQILSAESSPSSTWRDVFEKETTSSPQTQQQRSGSSAAAQAITLPVPEIKRDMEISKLLLIKYEESLRQIKETAERSRKIEEEMKILQVRKKEDVTNENANRDVPPDRDFSEAKAAVCSQLKPVCEANIPTKQKECPASVTSPQLLGLGPIKVEYAETSNNDVAKEYTNPRVRSENAKLVSWVEVKDGSGKITSGRMRQIENAASKIEGNAKMNFKSVPCTVESQPVMVRKLATPSSGQKSITCRSTCDVFDSLDLKRFSTPPSGQRTKSQTSVSNFELKKTNMERVTPKSQVLSPNIVSRNGVPSSGGCPNVSPSGGCQHVPPPRGGKPLPHSSDSQRPVSEGKSKSTALSSSDLYGIFSDTFLQNATLLSPEFWKRFSKGEPSEDLEWMKLIDFNGNAKTLDSEVFFQDPVAGRRKDEGDVSDEIRELLKQVKSLQMQNEVIKKGTEDVESMLKLSNHKTELSGENDKSITEAGKVLSQAEHNLTAGPIEATNQPSHISVHVTRSKANVTNDGKMETKATPWMKMRPDRNLIDFSICEDEESRTLSSSHPSSLILTPVTAENKEIKIDKLRPTAKTTSSNGIGHLSANAFQVQTDPNTAMSLDRDTSPTLIEPKTLLHRTEPAIKRGPEGLPHSEGIKVNNDNFIQVEHSADGYNHPTFDPLLLPGNTETSIAVQEPEKIFKNIEQTDLYWQSAHPTTLDEKRRSYITLPEHAGNIMTKDKLMPNSSKVFNLASFKTRPAYPNKNKLPSLPEGLQQKKINPCIELHGLPKPIIVPAPNSELPVRSDITQKPLQSFKTIPRPPVLDENPIRATNFPGSLPPGKHAKQLESKVNADNCTKLIIPKPIKQPPPETPSAFRQLRRKLRDGSPSPRKPRQRSPYSVHPSSKGISKFSRSKPTSSLLASPAFKSACRKRFAEALLDEEVSMLTCRTVRETPKKLREKSTANPLGRVLLEGDETHFIPLSPFTSTNKPRAIAGSAFSTYNHGK